MFPALLPDYNEKNPTHPQAKNPQKDKKLNSVTKVICASMRLKVEPNSKWKISNLPRLRSKMLHLIFPSTNQGLLWIFHYLISNLHWYQIHFRMRLNCYIMESHFFCDKSHTLKIKARNRNIRLCVVKNSCFHFLTKRLCIQYIGVLGFCQC